MCTYFFLLMFGCAAYFVLMFGLFQYVMYVKTHTWMNLRPRSVYTDGEDKVSLFLSMTLLFMSSTNIWGERQQQEEYVLKLFINDKIYIYILHSMTITGKNILLMTKIYTYYIL